jgi:hypothetical protein
MLLVSGPVKRMGFPAAIFRPCASLFTSITPPRLRFARRYWR